MNRTGLTLSAIMAMLGVAQLLFPAEVSTVFTLDSAVALFALAIAVLAYGVWFGPLKFLSGSRALRLMGFMVFVAGLASIGSPTLWGFRESFVPIADIFLVIETGIMLQLIGLEKQEKDVLSPLGYADLLWQYAQRRLHRGNSVPTTTHYVSR